MLFLDEHKTRVIVSLEFVVVTIGCVLFVGEGERYAKSLRDSMGAARR